MTDRDTARLIVLGDREVAYRIRRSQRARHAHIKVDRAGVEVVIPARAAKGWAEQLVQEHSRWILRRLEAVRRARELEKIALGWYEKCVPVQGEDVPVDVVCRGRAGGRITVAMKAGRLTVNTPDNCVAGVNAALERWLRRGARELIAERALRRCSEMDLRPNRICIRDQRTRWGSCSPKGNLSFSWRLIMAPPGVLDYIVVHESAHLAEPNHSPRFWRIVRAHCPALVEHKKWLRDHAGLLALLPRIAA